MIQNVKCQAVCTNALICVDHMLSYVFLALPLVPSCLWTAVTAVAVFCFVIKVTTEVAHDVVPLSAYPGLHTVVV